MNTEPARKTLSLAIPEAASTSLDLDFSERESDIIIGANEYFGQKDLGDGKGTRLTAHLSPRSKLVVSWTNNADSGARNLPLLTAQGEIAIDIDSEQMRARSSWAIGCVRGMTRVLEIRIDDEDEVTELQLDDQSTEAGIERIRGAGKLTIKLAEALRPGASKRLVLKTRRPFSISAPRRISFTGFPLTNAREQSGFIGITQSPNIWLSPVTSRGLRGSTPASCPRSCANAPRPSWLLSSWTSRSCSIWASIRHLPWFGPKRRPCSGSVRIRPGARPRSSFSGFVEVSSRWSSVSRRDFKWIRSGRPTSSRARACPRKSPVAIMAI